MSPDTLRNALAVLLSIDRHDLDRAGYSPTDVEWMMFRRNPFSFYLRATADRQVAIFNVINSRFEERSYGSRAPSQSL